MLTLNKLIPQGRGLAAVLVKRATQVTLDWDARSKSRLQATDSAGRELAIFLPRGAVLRGGDVLVAEDGSFVRVNAAPQTVMVVRHCSEHGTVFDLMRAAYHLGNRHVPLEVKPDHLKLEPDPVLADMLKRQHLIVSEEASAFEPEAGAYGAGGHDHDHGHSHSHDPAPKPAGVAIPAVIPVRAADAAHVHGPCCNHDHDHGHKH